jgi:DNA-binding FrmR family transcriptional regulator
MKTQEKKDVLKRLNNVLGHIQGNKKMIEEDKYCVDIIRQNQAVIAALSKVNKTMLRSHLETCVVPSVTSNVKSSKKKVFDEIADIFEMEQNSQ